VNQRFWVFVFYLKKGIFGVSGTVMIHPCSSKNEEHYEERTGEILIEERKFCSKSKTKI
jgi:hypothetical protein